MKFIIKHKIWFVCVFIFIIGLIPRVLDITGNSAFIDEIWWLDRGQFLFNNFFVDFDLGNLQHGWWKFGDTIALGLPTAFLIGIFQKLLVVNASSYSLEVYDMLGASRLPVALIGALTPALIYWFMQKLGHSKIGVLAALMLALDPVHIGLSRWAHQDVMLTFWMTFTIFSFFLYEKNQQNLWKNLSIAGLVLAFLTKYNALILLPILGLWKIWKIWKDKGGVWETKKIAMAILNKKYLWMLVWVLVFIMLLWPGDWTVFPPYTFFKYFFTQLGVNSYFDHTTFYLGKITADPAWHFYLIILAIRLTEITIIGFFLGIYIWWKKRRGDLDLWTLLWIWMIAYIVVMSVANKKLEVRYVLPVYPVIMIYAAWGLLATLRRILLATSRLHNLKLLGSDLFPLILVVIFISAYNLPILNHYKPSYYLYYNRIAGGPVGAKQLTTVGVNEGLKKAAFYVKENYPEEKKILLRGHKEPFLYYHKLKRENMFGEFEKHKDEIRVAVVESHFVQRTTDNLLDRLGEWGTLVHTVSIAGVDLVYIYEKN